MNLQELDRHLNHLLRIDEIKDDSLNGVQVANSGEIEKIAVAVDASYEAIRHAAKAGADCLLVHHGLFWGAPCCITGPLYQRIRFLIQSNMALYAAHLPLDMHPEVGNNAQLAKQMQWPVTGSFGNYHGTEIGIEVALDQPVTLRVISKQLAKLFDVQPLSWVFGPDQIQKIGIISGGALSMMGDAIREKVDLFITGEPKHMNYWEARESGLNVLFCGHYATETLGVKALGKHLSEKFGLECLFIDLPTGL